MRTSGYDSEVHETQAGAYPNERVAADVGPCMFSAAALCCGLARLTGVCGAPPRRTRALGPTCPWQATVHRMQDFGTFIVVSTREAAGIEATEHDTPWRVFTADDPTRRHWSDEHGHTSITLYGNQADERRVPPGHQLSHHVLIRAEDVAVADNVQSLVYGGILLGYPDLNLAPEPTTPYPAADVPLEIISQDPFRASFQAYEGVKFGCQVASLAWSDRSLIYAVEKYKRSLKLDSFTPHSAHPLHGQVFATEHPDFAYHVSAAFAIVVAYSVIEELGLEVRSSSRRPRFVGSDKDTWSPDVREDLHQRLCRAHMRADLTFRWTLRGAPTVVEQAMKPKFGTASSSYGRIDVRDREMELVDAIHQVSWLRNYVTAHRFSELVRAISPYDVHNCQKVARRLILGALNLWSGSDDH
jgi:hypothetical protein